MKQLLFGLTALLIFTACKKEVQHNYKPSFTSVATDTLLFDSISIRGLAIDGDKCWYSGSKGKYGWVSLSGGKGFSGIATQDTIVPEFRSIAVTHGAVFILSVGTPALLYKISKDGKITQLVYNETGDKVFYDSMKFFDDKDGMAMGDPQAGCLSILATADGGASWHKRDCTGIPQTVEGEAAFAASNTNIIARGGKAWMVSGGKKSRIFASDNKGFSWKDYDTPIVQGGAMTGIFSADFYDGNIGFAAGGDYDKPTQNTGNKAYTTDGGKTWQLVGEGTGPGYISCVQFVPKSNGNELVTVGGNGVFYSYDRGATWKRLSGDKGFNTLQFADNKVFIAAGQNKIIRFRLK